MIVDLAIIRDFFKMGLKASKRNVMGIADL
jgi:hypothetical protein